LGEIERGDDVVGDGLVGGADHAPGGREGGRDRRREVGDGRHADGEEGGREGGRNGGREGGEGEGLETNTTYRGFQYLM